MAPATKIDNGNNETPANSYANYQVLDEPSSSDSSSNLESSSEEEGGSTDCGNSYALNSVGKQKKKQRNYHASCPYYRNDRENSPESTTSDSSCEENLNKLDLNKNFMESKALALMSKYKDFIVKILSVEEYKTFDCHSDAQRLANVCIVMTKTLQLGNFLTMFGHSVSCRKPNCTTSCRMLRRVRCHVINATHSCALMHVYGQLLRLHVDTCHVEDGRCGMKSCKGMRDMRCAQGNKVLPRNFRSNEIMIAKVLIKKNVNAGTSDSDIITEKVITKVEFTDGYDKKTALDLDEKTALDFDEETALDLSIKQATKLDEENGKNIKKNSDEAIIDILCQ